MSAAQIGNPVEAARKLAIEHGIDRRVLYRRIHATGKQTRATTT